MPRCLSTRFRSSLSRNPNRGRRAEWLEPAPPRAGAAGRDGRRPGRGFGAGRRRDRLCGDVELHDAEHHCSAERHSTRASLRRASGTGPVRSGSRRLGGLGRVVHGRVHHRTASGGYQTVEVQTGKVTAVSTTSITVTSADGYSHTYARDRLHRGRLPARRDLLGRQGRSGRGHGDHGERQGHRHQHRRHDQGRRQPQGLRLRTSARPPLRLRRQLRRRLRLRRPTAAAELAEQPSGPSGQAGRRSGPPVRLLRLAAPAPSSHGRHRHLVRRSSARACASSASISCRCSAGGSLRSSSRDARSVDAANGGCRSHLASHQRRGSDNRVRGWRTDRLNPRRGARYWSSTGRLRQRRDRLRRRRSDVAGRGADELAGRGLLGDVGAPADDPADGEGRREQLPGEAAAIHDHAGIELHIGVQGVRGLQLGQHPEDRLLDLDGQLAPRRRPRDSATSRSSRDRGSSVRYTA